MGFGKQRKQPEMKVQDFRPSLSPFLKSFRGLETACHVETHLQALSNHNSARLSSSSAWLGLNEPTAMATPPLSPAESYASLCELLSVP